MSVHVRLSDFAGFPAYCDDILKLFAFNFYIFPKVMLEMFGDINESTLHLLCTVERLPFAGHMIAIALTHAHKCHAKEVKLTALNFLQVSY